MLVFAAIVPHPLESIAGIGTAGDFQAIKKTLHSFDEIRRGLEKAAPDTVIIISPHAHMEPYSFVINSASVLRGSFGKFGIDRVYEYENNIEFVNKIKYACMMNEAPEFQNESPVVLRDDVLDYGALVPLHHLLKNIKPMVMHLSFSLMDFKKHYRYGEILQVLIGRGCGGRVAVIASAELSHKLVPSSPAGYSRKAQKFDSDFIHLLGAKNETSLLDLQPEILKEIAECGVRSIAILLGVLHGISYKFKLLSYEGSSGIGYLTARMLWRRQSAVCVQQTVTKDQ